jgi:hypothetical protein
MEPSAWADDIAPERCANLRSKSMFIDAPWDPTVQRGNDRLFWCLHTQNCLGPDGKVADDEECNGKRGCYEAL